MSAADLYTTNAYIDEVADLANRLVNQIEWVAVCNYDESGNPFAVMDDNWAREATQQAKRPAVARALQQLISAAATRTKAQYENKMLIDREPVPAAARIVVWAIKTLFITMDGRNKWLKNRQLVIQFESIHDPETLKPIPWVEDLTRAQQIVVQ